MTDSELNAYHEALESGIPNLSIDIVGSIRMTGTGYVYTGDFALVLGSLTTRVSRFVAAV